MIYIYYFCDTDEYSSTREKKKIILATPSLLCCSKLYCCFVVHLFVVNIKKCNFDHRKFRVSFCTVVHEIYRIK
mgnify:CR=1 FL=1